MFEESPKLHTKVCSTLILIIQYKFSIEHPEMGARCHTSGERDSILYYVYDDYSSQYSCLT